MTGRADDDPISHAVVVDWAADGDPISHAVAVDWAASQLGLCDTSCVKAFDGPPLGPTCTRRARVPGVVLVCLTAVVLVYLTMVVVVYLAAVVLVVA